MPNGDANAIRVINFPAPAHEFNFDVVGRGGSYSNFFEATGRCMVDITAGVAGLGKFMSHAVELQCVVSTGNRRTIFKGDIAEKLGLSVTGPVYRRRAHTPFGRFLGFWNRQRLRLQILPGNIDVDVWFPVNPTNPSGPAPLWQWRTGFLTENLLGMTGVLPARMLCFTPQKLYTFELLRP